jgi:hypothetical protein
MQASDHEVLTKWCEEQVRSEIKRVNIPHSTGVHSFSDSRSPNNSEVFYLNNFLRIFK